VSTIALLCLVLLCTPVQLDCSLVALQADLLFTPVNTCSVYSLEALQANFEDPFLEPQTPTPVPSQPGHTDIGIGNVLRGEGIPKGLVKVDTVHPITRIEVSLLQVSEIVFYSRHKKEGIIATTKLTKSNSHVRLLAGDSIIFNKLSIPGEAFLEGWGPDRHTRQDLDTPIPYQYPHGLQQVQPQN
jgi:hypothetical protein